MDGAAPVMISVSGSRFLDRHGRTLMLRGANVGGSSKVPRVPDGGTHVPGGLTDHRHVSFVGRPFPAGEAEEHFERLRSWGLTVIRLLVTWEAVEHAGPGAYDQEYLDYLHELVARAGSHGISVIIDPHQDVWSRWCGGDGAPGWTLEAAGFDLASLDETGAAVTHQRLGDPLPPMLWPSNSGKLAAATMFTLFFGGNELAPRTLVDGAPIQEYLQRRFLGTFSAVAARLSDLPNVVGFDTMNEPLPGYIGWEDLNAAGGVVVLGDSPTAFQGMLLGAGFPQEVAVRRMGLASIRQVGTRTLNPGGARAWLPGRECVWRQNGVWDVNGFGQPVLRAPGHFTRCRDGRRVSFAEDCYRPFARRFVAAIREVSPRAIIFLEGEANGAPPRWSGGDGGNVAFAPHWYDGAVMARKHYSSWMAVDSARMRVVLGRRAARLSVREQLARFVRAAADRMEGAPVLLGEFGIPFDLDHGKAYRTGDFSSQEKALDRSFRAIEETLVSCLVWNYCADNTNAHGDQWNGEDLSIFSPDQRRDPADTDSGGRALQALVRPYPMATAGEPLSARFNIRTRVFDFVFRSDPGARAPTLIFVPRLQYAAGITVTVSDGTFQHKPDLQVLEYCCTPDGAEHRVRFKPREEK